MMKLTILLVWSLLGASAACAAAPVDVWLDVDCAIGIPGSDVDDGLAMIQAFHSPALRVRGVSTVHGNAALAPGLPVAREVVARFGPPGMPVWPGAARASDLGRETPATRALAASLRERPLTLLALGPLTNVGTLLELHPALAGRIQRVVIVAGRRPGQSFRSSPGQPVPFRDFNFELDPIAAQVLLDAPVELWMAPWEISSHVWITPSDLEALARAGGSGAFLWLRCQEWMRMWRRELHAPGFNPFDTLAVGWLTHPGLITAQDGAVAIERHPDDLPHAGGARPLKPYLVFRPGAAGRRARYAYAPAPGFHAVLMHALDSAPRQP